MALPAGNGVRELAEASGGKMERKEEKKKPRAQTDLRDEDAELVQEGGSLRKGAQLADVLDELFRLSDREHVVELLGTKQCVCSHQ